jgi:hypothetical protein
MDRILTTSTNCDNNALTEIDMSDDAIRTRLKRVSQLRRLCLALAAGRELTGKKVLVKEDKVEVDARTEDN